MRKYLPALLFIVLIISCQPEIKENVTKWPYGVNYEVFVMAFADTDGNGKGDLKGLTAKLDYLKSLGVGGLWLMPIMPSDTYHKYHVIDYKNIDPDFGTMEDFKAFTAEAHKRNIKVIIDLVINHSGDNHPWFLESKKGPDNPYREYYVWKKKADIRNDMKKLTTHFDSNNIQQWHAVNGDTLGEHYYGYFNGQTPDLNLDSKKVRDEVIDISKFWLTDMQVDGFRLDAARHVFPTDREKDNHAFWEWFRAETQKIKPDVYLVGEVWQPAEVVAPYLKGLPALFNFDMGYAITGTVQQSADSNNIVKKYKDINDYYKAITPDFIDATFIKNHDQNRILSELGGDVNKMKVAAGILFTLPGTPYVYYGEEIGMLGMKPDPQIREPFIWDVDKKDPMQTAWAPAVHSTDKTVVPAAAQDKDPYSLLNFYRKWIAYRNTSNALTYGSLELSPYQDVRVVSMVRVKDSEKVLAMHNLTNTEISIDLAQIQGFSKVDFSVANAKVDGPKLILPAYSSVVLK
jgi:alpha-amylase